MDLNKTIKELSQNEKKVLLTLKKLNGKGTPEEILKNGDFQQKVEVMNAASWLQSKKLIKIEEHIKTVYTLGPEGKHFLEKGLPEKRALEKIAEKKGKVSLRELTDILSEHEIPIAIGWLIKNRWAKIQKNHETFLQITEEGKKVLGKKTLEEQILKQLRQHPYTQVPDEKIKTLLSRKNVIKKKEIITSIISLTDNGKKILQKEIKLEEEITQITSSIIKNGEWKNKKIRPYDIHAFTPSIYGGKPHPLIELINRIRRIFLEMGFQEIEGNFVESSFWNMDVLFIPQDHPAREMQDTLYCKKPSRIPIKEKKLLETIAMVHEHGGNTSSTGWQYKFSKKEGEKALLRTHTTVNTIRYLYNNPHPPSKVFSIGRVFRKENLDATHLPEFYQIEGIVHEKNTNFRQLIGVLKEFYHRMGFEKIRFRPAYFPYTEPSMEIEVFWNNKWMELGGSGIFRPEVTEPIGIKNPVLAWGLGLERLAMLKLGLKDIRKLYISDIDWLRKKALI
ncbi:MAG: phenylalanine--tRNA ligase subunit alpha [Thermoplasmata archaeon]|nr:MAG: phenylalanine--tRNA ligase subunit alpha [Thermoplasmata archaeon]